MLQFFDELRVLIRRSSAEASGRTFGQVFASEPALMKNGQFKGRRIRELSSVKIVLLGNYDAIKVEEGLRN